MLLWIPKTTRWCSILVAGSMLLSGSASAQAVTPVVLPPSITQGRTSHSPSLPYTAAEWQHGLALFNMQARADQSPDVEVFPKDSLRAAARMQVEQWLKPLTAVGIQGIQADPHGSLLVAADQDEAARRAFAQRLAAPGVTLPDSAFTLLTAVQAFADADRPERLAVAEEYMARLDALSDEVAYWQYTAHQALSLAYYLAGQRPAVVTHGVKAIDRLPVMWFKSRRSFFQSSSAANMYLSIIDVMFGEPNGAARIQELNARIRAATQAPAELVSVTDSSFLWLGQSYLRGFQTLERQAALLGQPAPPVRGHRWLNRDNTGDHEEVLRDGVIRLVGLGTQTSSLSVLAAFHRIRTHFSANTNFEPLYLAETDGYWGVAFTTPQEETAHITQYFTKRRPTLVPVAIWAGEKQADAEGAMRPQRSPTVLAFRTIRRPSVYIVDGQGIVRRVFMRFSREDEDQAVAMITYLLKEAHVRPSTSPAP